MSHWSLVLLLLAAASCGRREPFLQRGVNFTAERPAFYGSPEALAMIEHLPQYGVNSIALVPYGFSRQGEPEVRYNPHKSWERDAGVRDLAAKAHQLGLKVMLKPQVWVPRGYPGDLSFPHPGDREKWFATYLVFLSHYARLATEIRADIFCIGVEFARLTNEEAAWRRLIARTRELYKGPIVYAASHGPEFENIRFWDALDYIGLNNYYPLDASYSASATVAKVEAVQARYRKPVLFPEAGYSSIAGAHAAPWKEGGEVSLEEQARCYEALLRAFSSKPWFQGIYWWKVGTNGFGGSGDASHTPWGKPAMQIVRRWWSPPTSPPAPSPRDSDPSRSP